MGNKDRSSETDSFVPEVSLMGESKLLVALAKQSLDDPTSRIKVREAMAILEEATEGTTLIHQYQPKAARVSWIQRVLGWFRRG